LERLATALFATRRLGASASDEERARLIVERKPEVIDFGEALASVREFDQFAQEFAAQASGSVAGPTTAA
jgi:hypothetical protein